MTDHLEMVYWPIDKPILYARNPRKNDAVIDRMISSIQEFGFQTPILAQSNGTVIDGHLRLKAARKMGLTEIPVVLADGLTEVQVKAFRLLANRSVQWADWDMELLALEFDDLKAEGFDLDLTGFDADELAGIDLNGELESAPASSATEIDPDDYQMGCKCPRCGFEFDDKQA